MNDKLAFQITEIENGFIISTPGVQDKVRGVIKEPESYYCAGFEEVSNKLRELFDDKALTIS